MEQISQEGNDVHWVGLGSNTVSRPVEAKLRMMSIEEATYIFVYIYDNRIIQH